MKHGIGPLRITREFTTQVAPGHIDPTQLENNQVVMAGFLCIFLFASQKPAVILHNSSGGKGKRTL